MNIKKYDNKRVRLKDFLGDIYEGIAMHNSVDYNYHEYGVEEEGLQLGCFLFYKSQIKKIEEIKEFSNIYGKLEEEVLEDPDLIEEIFEREEDIHIYRLLLCIEDNLNNLKEKEKLLKLIKDLIKYNEDDKIIKKAVEIEKKLEE